MRKIPMLSRDLLRLQKCYLLLVGLGDHVSLVRFGAIEFLLAHLTVVVVTTAGARWLIPGIGRHIRLQRTMNTMIA